MFEEIAREMGRNPGAPKMFTRAAVSPLLGLTSFSDPEGDGRHYILVVHLLWFDLDHAHALLW